MAESRLRTTVKTHIAHYHNVANLLTIHKNPDYTNASIQGSGEALLNASPVWWHDRIKPFLCGTELEKYGQAISVVNELLVYESEGMEEFNPE